MRTKKDNKTRLRRRIGSFKRAQLSKAVSEHITIAKENKQKALVHKEKVVDIFKKTKGELYYNDIKINSRIDDDYELRKIIKALLKEEIIEEVERSNTDKNGFEKQPTYKHRSYRLRI